MIVRVRGADWWLGVCVWGVWGALLLSGGWGAAAQAVQTRAPHLGGARFAEALVQ